MLDTVIQIITMLLIPIVSASRSYGELCNTTIYIHTVDDVIKCNSLKGMLTSFSLESFRYKIHSETMERNKPCKLSTLRLLPSHLCAHLLKGSKDDCRKNPNTNLMRA